MRLNYRILNARNKRYCEIADIFFGKCAPVGKFFLGKLDYKIINWKRRIKRFFKANQIGPYRLIRIFAGFN